MFSSANSGVLSGNHAPYFNGESGRNRGLIKEFDGEKFTEYLVEIDRNSYIYSEDKEEKLFEFGKVLQTIKKELFYIQN